MAEQDRNPPPDLHYLDPSVRESIQSLFSPLLASYPGRPQQPLSGNSVTQFELRPSDPPNWALDRRLPPLSSNSVLPPLLRPLQQQLQQHQLQIQELQQLQQQSQQSPSLGNSPNLPTEGLSPRLGMPARDVTHTFKSIISRVSDPPTTQSVSTSPASTFQGLTRSPLPSSSSPVHSGHSKPKRALSSNQGSSSSSKSVIGILDVHILSASLLHDFGPFGPHDVYAKLICGNINLLNQAVLQTRVIKGGGITPIFNQKLQVAISHDVDELRIEMWMASHNRGSFADQLLGFTNIPSTMFPAQEVSKKKRCKFSLFEKRDMQTVMGEVDVVLSYHSRYNLPPNPSRPSAGPATTCTPTPNVPNLSGNDCKRRASDARVEQMSQPKLLEIDLADALQILVEQRAAEYFDSLKQSQAPLDPTPSHRSQYTSPLGITPTVKGQMSNWNMSAAERVSKVNADPLSLFNVSADNWNSTGSSGRDITESLLNEANWEKVSSDCLAGEFSCSSDISVVDSASNDDFEEVSQQVLIVSQNTSDQCNCEPSHRNIIDSRFCIDWNAAKSAPPKTSTEQPPKSATSRDTTKFGENNEGKRNTSKKRSYMDMKENDYYLNCDFSREILASKTKLDAFKRDLLPQLIQNQEGLKKSSNLSLQQQFELKQLYKKIPAVSSAPA